MPDIFDSSKTSVSDALKKPDISETPASEPLSSSTSSTFHERKQTAIAQLMEDMKLSSNPLGSFSARPKNTCIDIQMEDEDVLLLMRQHPITQLRWIIIALLMILVPILFAQVPLLDFLPARFQVVAFIGWYLMIVGFVLESFLGWFYNIYIVTNQRVIDIDFNSLLFKHISTAKLDRIEDVSVTSRGYLGSIFDYGTVVIQTAGAVDQFEFVDNPHPNRVAAFIDDLLAAERGAERNE